MAHSHEPHAFVLPLPFHGHIHPLMELSKRLVSAGYRVTFANTQFNHQRIQAFLQKHDEEEEEGEQGSGLLRLVSLEEGFPAVHDNPFDLLAAAISPAMRAAVDRLLAQLLQEDPPVSCLVSDFRLLFTQDIAHKLGIPRLAFWTQSAAVFSSNLLMAQGFQPPPDDSTLITCIRGVPPHRRSDISSLSISKRLPEEYVWGPFERIREPKWVVINTFEGAEATTLQALQESLGFRPLTLGPLVDAPCFSISQGVSPEIMGSRLTSSYLEWLRAHPPASVLYIAFGTVVTLSDEQLEELVLGLEATQKPLFWVFRSDLPATSGKFTLATLPHLLKNQARVVPWAPQLHILSHPSVGGFLSHCGWNSTLEAITAGVPMLAWPQNTDQFLTRRCVEDQWGIGLGLEAGENSSGLVSRVEVQTKVRELMQGEKSRQMREKASKLSDAAKRALLEGGSSHQDLQLLLRGGAVGPFS